MENYLLPPLLKNNTSSNTIENEKNAAYRESIQKQLNPKNNYEYERERAYREKQNQISGKPVSSENITPFMYTSWSNHNNDHDNHNNYNNNNNLNDDYYDNNNTDINDWNKNLK